MTFSDENLKWLKKNIEDSDRKLNKFGYFLDLEEFEALLHRLECAEHTIRELQQCIKCKCDPWPCLAIKESLQAWRTSAGKDPTND